LKQLEGDQQALRELARMFQELAPARLASLEAAAASWDVVRIRHVAHDLRGMLGMIAAGEAAEAAARVETAAEQGVVEEACSACARLRQEIDRVLEALGSRSWKHAA
jgi:HPt (histidine-containing phosphotransfer) domain-containing protein